MKKFWVEYDTSDCEYGTDIAVTFYQENKYVNVYMQFQGGESLFGVYADVSRGLKGEWMPGIKFPSPLFNAEDR